MACAVRCSVSGKCRGECARVAEAKAGSETLHCVLRRPLSPVRWRVLLPLPSPIDAVPKELRHNLHAALEGDLILDAGGLCLRLEEESEEEGVGSE